MKKAIVYIDGYNLYFGPLKGTPWKWLDLWKFAETLVAGRFELVEVRYFTAPIKTHPVDLAATERQNAYVQTLATLSGVKVVQGFYSKSKMRVPPVDEKCTTMSYREKKNRIEYMVTCVGDFAHAHKMTPADAFLQKFKSRERKSNKYEKKV